MHVVSSFLSFIIVLSMHSVSYMWYSFLLMVVLAGLFTLRSSRSYLSLVRCTMYNAVPTQCELLGHYFTVLWTTVEGQSIGIMQ